MLGRLETPHEAAEGCSTGAGEHWRLRCLQTGAGGVAPEASGTSKMRLIDSSASKLISYSMPRRRRSLLGTADRCKPPNTAPRGVDFQF